MDATQFTVSDSPIVLSDALLLSFLLLAALYVLFSGVFYYHWQEYSSDKRVTGLTYIAYAVTTVPTMAILATIAFTT